MNNDSGEPGFAGFAQDTRQLWRDVAEMISLRRDLAEEEIRSDVASAKRFAIKAAVGLVAALTGLPLLLGSICTQLEGWLRPQAQVQWFSIALGGLFVAAGLLTLWVSWRRFRREFVGLEESLAELREDVLWLRQWVQQQETGDPT